MKKSISLKDANELLRSGKWKEAIEAYKTLWDKWNDEPALRETVRQNIEFMEKNAPVEFLGDDQCANLKCFPFFEDLKSRVTNINGQGELIPALDRVKTLENSPNLYNALKKCFGIEKIYAVNLERRPDRYIRLLREFNFQSIKVSKINGIDAKFSQEALDNYNAFIKRGLKIRSTTSIHISDAKMRLYKNSASVSWFAYLLSQRKVFEDAIKNGYGRILILDDDVFFSTDAIDRLNRLADKIPDDFKVFLMGASEYSVKDSDEFLNAAVSDMPGIYRPIPGKTCGSFAVVYDSSVFPDMLKAIDEADGPFDNIALGYIYNKFAKNCFSFASAVCIPDVGDSDIRPNKRAQSEHSEKMGWEFTRYAEYTKDFRISILVDSVNAVRHVSTLAHELPSNIILNLYYLSGDGLRPIITGHQCDLNNLTPVPVVALNNKQLLALIEECRMPHSDLVLKWSDMPISEVQVLRLTARALELKNSKSICFGILEGVRYVLDAGIIPVKGRHSVVIPSFRVVENVWPTIKSVLSQDASDFEVIVVNDNPINLTFSADLTKKLEGLKGGKYAAALDRVKVIDHAVNRNASAARNTGYFASSGEFVTFLDDDDTFDVSRLSGVELELSASSKEVGACYCGYRGKWNGEKDMARFPEGDLGDKVLALKYAEHYMCTNTVTFKRSSLDRLGGLNERYHRHQDLELMARFFKYSKIIAVKKFLVNNRPNVVPETFVADMEKMVRLKFHFLSDMKPLILVRGDDFVELVVNAHAKDIIKRGKNMPEETKNIIKLFLTSALR